MHFYLTASWSILCCSLALSQIDSSYLLPEEFQDQMESFVNNLEDPTDFDFNTIGENLEHFVRNPIDLNKATFQELQELGLLSELQITELIFYREQLDDLISFYELQAVPLFDLSTINRIRPFVTVNSATDPTIHLMNMVRGGYNQVFLRYGRTLETKKGYLKTENGDAAYLGNADRYYMRFRHNYENKLSYGFTLEKDPGEPLIREQSKFIDYSSFHFYLRDYSQLLKGLIVGDFQVGLGQGLIMHSGFGRGKSSIVNRIKKGGRQLRPYTSVSENRFLRGAAIHLESGPFGIVLFASQNKHDGNLVDLETGDRVISSLQESGYHRTVFEMEDHDAVKEWVAGGKIGYKSNQFRTNVNFVYNRLNIAYQPTVRAYNRYYFRGQTLLNCSLDYTYQHRNLHFFGETGISSNGGMATLNGLMMTLGKRLDLSLLYRYYGVKYQALHSNAFAESSQVNNEKGLYLGLEVRVNPNLRLSFYADHFQFDWLTFNTDVPSQGHEYLVRLTYFKKRKLEAYAQYRFEEKAISTIGSDPILHATNQRQRNYARFHLNHKIRPFLEFRNRIEFSWSRTTVSEIHTGFLLYQDILFKPLDFPLSFTTRMAYFDMDDYAARIYAFENDLLYNFSIPAYFGEGFRYYLNLRYRVSRSTTLEGRWDQTVFAQTETISSGWEEIQGNKKSNIKLQLRIQF